MESERIRKQILEICQKRGAEKTVCPSEVARYLAPKAWRPLMFDVRREAIHLMEEGAISILQKGEEVDPRNKRGPIRLKWVPKS